MPKPFGIIISIDADIPINIHILYNISKYDTKQCGFIIICTIQICKPVLRYQTSLKNALKIHHQMLHALKIYTMKYYLL